MKSEVNLIDALHPAGNDGVEMIRHPIDPPEFELFAQRIVSNVGQVKEYVLRSYKEAGLDPLVHSMFKTWTDVPAIVKGRVKYLLSISASSTVADRRELEEFLTAIIRDDERIADRRDRKRLDAMDAVKELCKMRGFYSPVEIKNTHEIVVPDAIRNLSDEQLIAMANSAKDEVIDVDCSVAQISNESN